MELAEPLTLLHAKLDTLLERSSVAERRFLTVANAAQYADLSEESIRRLLASGKLTGLRPLKGRVLIDRRQLDALVLSSTTKPRTGRGRPSHP
jgi:excisionase family DNA binding protein